MSVTAKDFIEGKEIVFVGYSGNETSFSRSVYRDFVNAGLTVYPVNTRGFTDNGVKVYGSVAAIGKVPEAAFVILNAGNALKAVEDLSAAGVKRVWFQGTETADGEVLAACEKAGIEPFVGCGKMYLSNGFIHKLHGFFAGARR
jgi:predicted CoA-binding protein